MINTNNLFRRAIIATLFSRGSSPNFHLPSPQLKIMTVFETGQEGKFYSIFRRVRLKKKTIFSSLFWFLAITLQGPVDLWAWSQLITRDQIVGFHWRSGEEEIRHPINKIRVEIGQLEKFFFLSLLIFLSANVLFPSQPIFLSLIEPFCFHYDRCVIRTIELFGVR